MAIIMAITTPQSIGPQAEQRMGKENRPLQYGPVLLYTARLYHKEGGPTSGLALTVLLPGLGQERDPTSQRHHQLVVARH